MVPRLGKVSLQESLVGVAVIFRVCLFQWMVPLDLAWIYRKGHGTGMSFPASTLSSNIFAPHIPKFGGLEIGRMAEALNYAHQLADSSQAGTRKGPRKP